MPDVNLIPEEYKKRKEKLSTIFSKTGGVVLGLVILSLLFYGGLLSYQNKLNKELDNIEEQIKVLNQKRDPETEEAVVDLDKKLRALKKIFENHVYWSKLFSKIEELTVPQAYFSKVKLDSSEREINISFSGNTPTYTILAKQMKSFQEDSQVESIRVSDLSLSAEGGIDWELKIIFSKDILLNHD